MSAQTSLYVGHVGHRRLKPRRHQLRYRAYWLLIDLDELDSLAGRLRFFSHNGFNLFAIYDRDHGDRSGNPLRAYVERELGAAGVALTGGRILLLTMPRILGYVFNPLSVYLCYRETGELAAVLYEVTNTGGERHTYLIAARESGPVAEQGCRKQLFVSPFLETDMHYDFRLQVPGSDVKLVIRASDTAGPVVVAWLSGTRRALSDRALLCVFFSHPLLTLKVIAAIHWEALRLWLKGVRLKTWPAPPAEPVTVIHAPARSEETRV